MPPATSPAFICLRADSRSIGGISIRRRRGLGLGAPCTPPTEAQGTRPRSTQPTSAARRSPGEGYTGLHPHQAFRAGEAVQLTEKLARYGSFKRFAAVPAAEQLGWLKAACPGSAVGARRRDGVPPHRGSRTGLEPSPLDQLRDGLWEGVPRPSLPPLERTQTLAAMAIERNRRARYARENR